MRLANLLHTIPLRLRSLLDRSAVERDLDEELRFHLEQQVAQNVARGMAPHDARRAAMIAMGGLERRKDEARDTRRVEVIENVFRDMRHAARALLHNRMYAIAAILTLTLGLGANTAIFTVVRGVLLADLAYADPSRLVTVNNGRGSTVAPGVFLDWEEASLSFSHMAAAQYWTPNLTGTDRPEQLTGLLVTPSLFPMYGVTPVVGRALLPSEGEPGQDAVVVLGYSFWQTRFASDSSAVGRTLRLDGRPYRIVGVMPRGFQFAPYWATKADLAAPLVLGPKRQDRGGSSLRSFARLAPGVTIDQARADMKRIAARLEPLHPGTNQNVTVTPLREEVVGDVRPAMLILLGAAGLVLLIACANVAHLQLVRATTRARELALRAALGASRARVIQQALVESIFLAAAGGALGLLVAAGGVRLFVLLAPPSIPRLDQVAIEPSVLLFALGVTLVAGLLCGAIPAIKVAHLPSHDVLKEGSRAGGESRGQHRTRGALIVAEFALALMLLAGAGLLMKSFVALLRVDPGYAKQRLLSMQVSVAGTAHEPVTRRMQFFGELIARVSNTPGVEAVSAINHVPLAGDNWRFPFSIEGRAAAKPGAAPRAEFLVVHPGYFATMGIQLVRGSEIDAAGAANAERVIVISESMAKRYWPGETPIGRRISVDDPAKAADWFRIIGVARDVRQSAWAARTDQMYFPYIHDPRRQEREMSLASFLHPRYMTLVVRTAADPNSMIRSVQSTVKDMDSDAPVSSPITMEAAIGQQFETPRFYAVLIASLAGVALLLAAIGVFGVISYSVARRSREIGIRVALGAQRPQVVSMILGQGLRLAALGSAIGVVGAVALTRYLRGLLYDVAPTDPLTFVIVVLVLAGVALIACWVPARAALDVPPSEALRT